MTYPPAYRPDQWGTSGDHERRVRALEANVGAVEWEETGTPATGPQSAWLHCSTTSVLFASITEGVTGITFKAWNFDLASGDIVYDDIGLTFTSNDIVVPAGTYEVTHCVRPEWTTQNATRYAFARVDYITAVAYQTVQGPLSSTPVHPVNPSEIGAFSAVYCFHQPLSTQRLSFEFWEDTATGVLSAGRACDILIKQVKAP